MSQQISKMSVGSFAAVALVAGAVLALAGNAWAVIYFNNGTPASPYTVSSGTYTGGVDIRSTGGGTLNQTGGGITGTLRLGYGSQDPAGTSDIFNLSGGTYSAGDTNIGSEGGSYQSGVTATLAISGTGSYTGNGTARLGDGGGPGVTATLDVSGSGVYNNQGYYFQVGNGNSWIKVTGGLATIQVGRPYFGGEGSGAYVIGGMVFTLDSNGTNISKIVSNNGAFYLGNAGDAGKIDMNLSGYTPAAYQVFDLISSLGGAIRPVGDASVLLNAGDTTSWSLAVVNVSGVSTLRATYLPEPTTLALLGLGAAGILIRRRSRKS